MTGLVERLLAAAEAELDRQIEAGKPGSYLDAHGSGDWIIDGHVDMRALVGAVAGTTLVALREPKDEHLAQLVSPWDESLDERMTILDLKRAWFRQIMDAFAREHGLEMPRGGPQEPGTGGLGPEKG